MCTDVYIHVYTHICADIPLTYLQSHTYIQTYNYKIFGSYDVAILRERIKKNF